MQVKKVESRSQGEADEHGAEAAVKEEGSEQGSEATAKEVGSEQEEVDAEDSAPDWEDPAIEKGRASAAQEEETAAKEKEAEEAKEKEAEEAPEAQEGAGPANNRDCGAASAWAMYPSSWEAFRGERDADGFFVCPVCAWKSKARGAKHESALQQHVWSKASAGDGHPSERVQERWYPGWKTESANKKHATSRE